MDVFCLDRDAIYSYCILWDLVMLRCVSKDFLQMIASHCLAWTLSVSQMEARFIHALLSLDWTHVYRHDCDWLGFPGERFRHGIDLRVETANSEDDVAVVSLVNSLRKDRILKELTQPGPYYLRDALTLLALGFPHNVLPWDRDTYVHTRPHPLTRYIESLLRFLVVCGDRAHIERVPSLRSRFNARLGGRDHFLRHAWLHGRHTHMNVDTLLDLFWDLLTFRSFNATVLDIVQTPQVPQYLVQGLDAVLMSAYGRRHEQELAP